MFALPVMAPAPVLEPTPIGCVLRCCRTCEVTWHGQHGDACWCCDREGLTGPLRVVSARRGFNDGATRYQVAGLR